MVQIEEVNDVKKDAPPKEPKPLPNGRKRRKDMPSVGHLLAHGSEEAQGRPKTFCSVFGYPIFVAICFAISLLIFHYAPHDKSVQPRGRFAMNKQRPREQAQAEQAQAEQPPTILDDIVQPEEKEKDGEL